MNKLNAFMQDKYGMKSFTHTPETKQLPNLITETIKGKRFYVVGEEKFQFGLSSDIPVSARWFDMSSEGSLNSSGNLNSVFSSSDENGPGASEGGQDIVFDDVLSVYGPP